MAKLVKAKIIEFKLSADISDQQALDIIDHLTFDNYNVNANKEGDTWSIEAEKLVKEQNQ